MINNGVTQAFADRATAVAASPRVTIDTPKLSGSLSLAGGRIDDLLLKSYRETVDPTSPEVRLMSPVGKDHPYYAVFGWLAGNGLEPADVPDAKTQWSVAGNATLTHETPVTLTWQNTKGLTFTRTISIDADFMFTITDTVANFSAQPITIAPCETPAGKTMRSGSGAAAAGGTWVTVAAAVRVALACSEASSPHSRAPANSAFIARTPGSCGRLPQA
mgnify:CR=1 FL=1